MMRLHQLLLLPLLLSFHTVAAWGPLFELKKSGSGLGTLTLLKASLDGSSESDERMTMEVYRLRLEQTFLYDETDEILLPSLLSPSYRQYESKNDYSDNNNPWFELGAACTEDCDECAIPDEYKNVYPAEEHIDVMAFLGIRRAEPLRVNRKSFDWE